MVLSFFFAFFVLINFALSAQIPNEEDFFTQKEISDSVSIGKIPCFSSKFISLASTLDSENQEQKIKVINYDTNQDEIIENSQNPD